MDHTARRKLFAWSLLIASIIGYPLSALTFAAGEPPAVLALSWAAIALTAIDILMTVGVRNEQDKDKDDS